MSWERFLALDGVEDIDGEIEQIKEKMEFEAEVEAKQQPMMGGQNNANTNQNA
jgi:hypothetical protein